MGDFSIADLESYAWLDDMVAIVPAARGLLGYWTRD